MQGKLRTWGARHAVKAGPVEHHVLEGDAHAVGQAHLPRMRPFGSLFAREAATAGQTAGECPSSSRTVRYEMRTMDGRRHGNQPTARHVQINWGVASHRRANRAVPLSYRHSEVSGSQVRMETSFPTRTASPHTFSFT